MVDGGWRGLPARGASYLLPPLVAVITHSASRIFKFHLANVIRFKFFALHSPFATFAVCHFDGSEFFIVSPFSAFVLFVPAWRAFQLKKRANQKNPA